MVIFNNIKDILKNKEFYFYNDIESLINNIYSKLKQYFHYHLNLSKTFVAEIYVEREWRDLYSLHYSKTNYNISNKTIRIHFIKSKINDTREINDKNYLGYVTLRPIPVALNIVSRARLKYDADMYDITTKDIVVNRTINATVNMPHIRITYKTFPYTTQDSVVTVCAHADILMLSKYLYKKFNFNFLSINKLLDSITPTNGRKIPSQGMTIQNIIEVLNANNYNPSLIRLGELKIQIKNKIITFQEIVEVALRSGLPIMFIFSNHVVMIGGYIVKANGTKEYIIFDDSTYFMHKYFDSSKYTLNVSFDKIQNATIKHKEQFLVIPTFDRFYFKYKDLYLLLNIKDGLKATICKVNQKKIAEVSYEATLVESLILQQQFLNFDFEGFGHYMWMIKWFFRGVFIGLSIVDATAHCHDRYRSIMVEFIRKEDLNKRKNDGI